MQDDNPFAPGSGWESAANEEGSLSPVDLDLVPILERSWQLAGQHPGLVLISILFQVVPAGTIGVIQGFLQVAMDAESDESVVAMLSLLNFCAQILNLLIGVFVSLGLARVFTRLARGLPAEPGMLLGEGRNYFGALLATLTMAFAASAAVLVVMVPLGAGGVVLGWPIEVAAPIAAMLGLLILVLPLSVVGVGLQFFVYALVDQDLGPVAALRESWRLTDGYKVTIFLTDLAIVLLGMVLTCLTCGVGYLAFPALLSLVQAVMYHSLVHFQGTAISPRNA